MKFIIVLCLFFVIDTELCIIVSFYSIINSKYVFFHQFIGCGHYLAEAPDIIKLIYECIKQIGA